MSYIRKRAYADGSEKYTAGFKDQSGRWRERVVPGRKKDAENYLRRVLEEVAAGTFEVEREDPAFAEFAGGFLKAKKGEVKASTLDDYKRVIKNHLVPFFGKKHLSQITPSVVQGFILSLEGAGMSAAMRAKVLRYLKVLMRHAVRMELVGRDPCQAVTAPRVEAKEQRFLSAEEAERLITAAEGYMKPLLAVACYAGLRQGEILALTWEDVNLKSSTVRVRRTYHYTHGFTSPKTAASRRTVPIIPTLKAMLEDHYLSCGRPTTESLVFRNEAGKPIDRRNLVNRGLDRALKRAGIPPLRFHDLRHTFAALSIEAAVDPKTLQAMMGHASIKVSLDIYGHLYTAAFDRASKSLEAVISGGAKVIPMPGREAKNP
jgi:integrase